MEPNKEIYNYRGGDSRSGGQVGVVGFVESRRTDGPGASAPGAPKGPGHNASGKRESSPDRARRHARSSPDKIATPR